MKELDWEKFEENKSIFKIMKGSIERMRRKESSTVHSKRRIPVGNAKTRGHVRFSNVQNVNVHGTVAGNVKSQLGM
jgi:hypothetical protein